VVLGDGRELTATHRGEALIRPDVRLTDVLYVPGLQENLFSVSTAASRPGVRVVMEDGACKIFQANQEVIAANRDGGVFRVMAVAAQEHADGDIVDLHRRCGHTNFRTINLMSQLGILPRIETFGGDPLTKACELCLKGKMTRTVIPKTGRKRKSEPGDVIHSDLCGPMRTRSIQGNKYMVTYLDDATGWAYTGFISEKSQQLNEFKTFEAMMERQHRVKIRCLRSDGGGEYSSKEVQNYLKTRGIRWEHSAPRTPQQNGRSERLNRTIIEMARCFIIDAGLGHRYWQYAATMAVYIRNKTPSASNVGSQAPYELLYGRRPDLRSLPLFGAKSQVHIADEKRSKLEGKTLDCIFLGFADGVKAGVFEDTKTDRRFVSRDAVIAGVRIGNDFGTVSASEHAEDNSVKTENASSEHAEDNSVKTESTLTDEDQSAEPDSDPEINATKTDDMSHTRSNQNCELPRETRIRKAPIRYMYEWAYATTTEEPCEPKTAEDALSQQNWRAAMQEEYDALVSNGTWELVPEPAGRSVVTGKWCFKAKTDASGEVNRYKARYVARGFTQRPGIDFTETTSPVVSLTALRTLLSVAAREDMELKQLDVNSAFLYGHLDEEIYLHQPTGFEKTGASGERLVCKLRKAIYGLKQAGRVWWKLIDSELRKMDMENSQEEPCLYRGLMDEHPMLIAIYVDDLVIASKSLKAVEGVEHKLRRKFAMKVMGDASFVLGMHIARDRTSRTLTLSQAAYSRSILERFDMMGCRPVQSPVAAGTMLERHDGPAAKYEYSQAVGSLMYLAMGTRPDLAYAVGLVSRFAGNPGEHHVKAVKRMLRYLRGTIDMGLRWGGSPTEDGLACWADADYAGCITTRRSTTGYMCKFYGGAISWASRRQECAALSTTEAEYMALCAAAKEVAWLRGLLDFMGFRQEGSTTIYQDNQSTIALAENGKVSRRSKHIEVRFHYTREKIQDGAVKLVYCPTTQMVADVLTKPMPQDAFTRLSGEFMAPCPVSQVPGSSGGSVKDPDRSRHATSQ